MATIKLLFLCFFILMVTVVSLTSCQGPSNSTGVTTTEKPEDDETSEAVDVKDESDSENETETESETESDSDSESESESDNDESDSKSEDNEKPKKSEESEESEESEKPEKPEKREKSDKNKEKKEKTEKDEIDLEDDPIPEPRCLARYNNLNCTEAQRQQAIINYKATRGQLIQTLLQPGNTSSGSSKTSTVNTGPITTISNPPTINSTQVFNISTSPLSNTTASSSSSSSSSSSTTTTTSTSTITSDISSCNRAIQLLANVDKYAKFNDSCQARVFGKRYNPDYWIARCMKSLRRRQ